MHNVITEQIEWIKKRNLGGGDQLIKMICCIKMLEAERDALKAELAERKDRHYFDVLELRGLSPERACEKCRGFGITMYASTATWRGGIGGQALTQDVCCQCWGSGDAKRPWKSWRS